MIATAIHKADKIVRPFATRCLPPRLATKMYSAGRPLYLEALAHETPGEAYTPPAELGRTLWGMRFQGPLMNAAGVFKDGACYGMVYSQGAGGYLGGTGTWNARSGNVKDGIRHPFVPYPRSHAASNYLGLPNDGDPANSSRAHIIEKKKGCPVEWSVALSPDLGDQALECLVRGMWAYYRAGVDFIEVNVSCPNTENEGDIVEQLAYVSEHFLMRRERRVPVIVKFSNDTMPDDVPKYMDILFRLGYDGANFGNTSVNYEECRQFIAPEELPLFDYFTETIGGGVSGRPLNEMSLSRSAEAAEYTRNGPPQQEFHVFRTGGIGTWKDIEESKAAGISMNQWLTAYAGDNFGPDVYKRMYEGR